MHPVTTLMTPRYTEGSSHMIVLNPDASPMPIKSAQNFDADNASTSKKDKSLSGAVNGKQKQITLTAHETKRFGFGVRFSRVWRPNMQQLLRTIEFHGFKTAPFEALPRM
jgi:hypothetical protein